MFKLIRYTLRNEFLKLGTYLIPMFGVVIYAILTYAQVFGKFAQENVSFIKSGNEYSFITIFAISVIFIAIKIVNIFQQPKDTGLDIIYSSKPISQKEITFSKFISIWIMIIYFSFIFFVATSLIALMDKHSSAILIWNYSISIFIGNVTILFALSSILIIFSTILSQKVILLLAAISSVFAPSFSIVLSQTIKPHMPATHLLPAYIKLNDNWEDITKTPLSKLRIPSEKNNTIFINKASIFVPNFKYKYEQYKTHTIYKTLAYFDPWYQFSSLYDVTYDTKFANNGKKWVERTMVFHKDKHDFSIKINGEEFTPMISMGFKGEFTKTNFSATAGLMNIDPLSSSNSLLYLKQVQKVSPKFNSWSFVKQMLFVGATIEQSTNKSKKDFNISAIADAIDKLSTKEANVQYGRGLLTIKINNKNELVNFKIDGFTLMGWSLMINNKQINKITKLTMPTSLGFINRFGDTYNLTLVKDGEKIPVILPVEYINKKGTYAIWFILAFIMVISSVVIITKKDSH